MSRCLTPASWAIDPERREVPFRNAVGTAGWRDELFQRIAMWEIWVIELGGPTFIEPPRDPTTANRYNVILDYATFLTSFDSREEALDLVVDMRAAGFDVRLERERRTA